MSLTSPHTFPTFPSGGWVKAEQYSTENKVFYVEEGHEEDAQPDNISIEIGTSRYAAEEHEQFRDAIAPSLIPNKTVHHRLSRRLRALRTGIAGQMDQAVLLLAYNVILFCDHIFLANGKNIKPEQSDHESEAVFPGSYAVPGGWVKADITARLQCNIVL